MTVSQGHPPVRFRNLESADSTINQVAFDGYYYFTVEMGGDSTRANENFQAPVRLAVAVDGQESGARSTPGRWPESLPASRRARSRRRLLETPTPMTARR